MSSLETVLSERDARYGSFASFAKISQAFKAVMSDALIGKKVTDVQYEAMDMIAHKLARIVSGDPNYIDSWQDLAGYATLVVRDLEKTAK